MADPRSPAPRSTSASATWRSAIGIAGSAVRSAASSSCRALLGRPDTVHMSASGTVVVSASMRFPAACRLSATWENVSSAACTSPSAQAASPRNPAPAARAKWSSGPASSSVRLACSAVPATSPRAWASDARYIAMVIGSMRSSSVCAHVVFGGAASARSASSRRADAPSMSPETMSMKPEYAVRTGRRRTSSAESASSQPNSVVCRRVRRISGSASSIRCPARSWSPPASAWEIASSNSSCCSYQRLAAWCSARMRSRSSASTRARRESANRWW